MALGYQTGNYVERMANKLLAQASGVKIAVSLAFDGNQKSFG
jgi:hypothetical protein